MNNFIYRKVPNNDSYNKIFLKYPHSLRILLDETTKHIVHWTPFIPIPSPKIEVEEWFEKANIKINALNIFNSDYYRRIKHDDDVWYRTIRKPLSLNDTYDVNYRSTYLTFSNGTYININWRTELHLFFNNYDNLLLFKLYWGAPV